ncbi:PREDICTED: uncharacterized protein LOC104805882 [Tarenaya hassleriana]|uniref:uncharacterized protein LOC104805882 n=1 Tax=Tarenaya hassleriana TaxID=28532 RepID=UPI00053C86ED|nr:PREDICTED: uncharacterized protein LOC104805882 [Tarenaya hassleriana]
MASSPISLLLIRRLSMSLPNPKSRRIFQPVLGKPLSTSAEQNPDPDSSPKPSSLSSRLSFVFDQIDAIEQRRSEQDETLERIRAWRQSKQTASTGQNLDPESVESDGTDANSGSTELTLSDSGELRKEKAVVELVHPWPEWMELMERLVQQNYLDHRRKDEDKMVESLGLDSSDIVEVDDGDDNVGNALLQDFKTVQNACINFGKDRFDIIRSLSRNDIQILVGHGCPTTDRKVVFSGKLLRKRVRLDEGDVCSSCSLRNSCEKAFLLTNKEDEARTIDLMRILFAYGFDPLHGPVTNKDLLKKKSVKNVIRKLIHEVVKLSAVPIDPNLPPPVIKKPPPKVKQPPPPPKKRVGRDDIEMKKGDWLCPKCDFMNFAKNTVCLQCDAKRPKRQLLPGEWECPECNFLNYRRNMACFHCDCKRPPDEFVENKTRETKYGTGTGTGTQRPVKRDDVSNAWNFDFDDDESDGADVAAFEYADSSLRDKTSDPPLEGFRDPDDEFDRRPEAQRFSMRESSDSSRRGRPGIGFDDFDDEDDVDSYEIDEGRDRDVPRVQSSSASYEFSEDEEFSEPRAGANALRGGTSKLYSNQNKQVKSKAAVFSDDDELGLDSDDEVSVTPAWRSSHVASNPRSPRSRKMSFGSDDDSDFDSELENDGPEENFRRGKRDSGGRGAFKNKRSSFSPDDSDFDMDNRDRRGSSFSGNRSRENRGKSGGFGGRTRNSPSSFNNDFDRNNGGRGAYKSKSNSFSASDSDFDADDRSYRGSRGNRADNRGFRGTRNKQGDFNNGFDRNRSRGSNAGSFGGSNRGGRGGGFGNRHRQDNDKDRDYGEFRNSRRVIER